LRKWNLTCLYRSLVISSIDLFQQLYTKFSFTSFSPPTTRIDQRWDGHYLLFSLEELVKIFIYLWPGQECMLTQYEKQKCFFQGLSSMKNSFFKHLVLNWSKIVAPHVQLTRRSWIILGHRSCIFNWNTTLPLCCCKRAVNHNESSIAWHCELQLIFLLTNFYCYKWPVILCILF
jgi:hypothetical protein